MIRKRPPVPLMLRLRHDLIKRLRAAAKKSERSMNSDICARLEKSFEYEKSVDLSSAVARIEKLLTPSLGAAEQLTWAAMTQELANLREEVAVLYPHIAKLEADLKEATSAGWDFISSSGEANAQIVADIEGHRAELARPV